MSPFLDIPTAILVAGMMISLALLVYSLRDYTIVKIMAVIVFIISTLAVIRTVASLISFEVSMPIRISDITFNIFTFTFF